MILDCTQFMMWKTTAPSNQSGIYWGSGTVEYGFDAPDGWKVRQVFFDPQKPGDIYVLMVPLGS